MIRSIRRLALWVGASALTALIAGGTAAQAKGVVITSGGVQGVGDPFYDYAFNVYLDSGITLQNGDSFTLSDLTGIAPGGIKDPTTGNTYYATTYQPDGPSNGDAYGPFVPSIALVAGSSPDASNVTWTNYGSAIVNNTGGELFVGQFVVDGNVALTNGQQTTAPNYVGSAHTNGGASAPSSGSVSLSSTITYIPQVAAVPEPSSIMLMLAGGCIFPYLASRRQRQTTRTS